jgi:type I restriction enzyme R subunit
MTTPTPSIKSANFDFLAKHDAQLARLGTLAERYFGDDPNTALMKLRQFAELLAQPAAAKAGLFARPDEPQSDLLRRLKFERVLPTEVADLFHQIRISGNAATHAFGGDHAHALTTLKIARQLGIWYYRTFIDKNFKSSPFVPPLILQLQRRHFMRRWRDCGWPSMSSVRPLRKRRSRLRQKHRHG